MISICMLKNFKDTESNVSDQNEITIYFSYATSRANTYVNRYNYEKTETSKKTSMGNSKTGKGN